MDMNTWYGILIPFAGTTLGSACVFFMRKTMSQFVQRSAAGFAGGVMVAASVWSLLIPAIDQSAAMGKWSFLPAFVPTGGSSGEYCTMGETLMQRRRVKEEVFRYVNFYQQGRK